MLLGCASGMLSIATAAGVLGFATFPGTEQARPGWKDADRNGYDCVIDAGGVCTPRQCCGDVVYSPLYDCVSVEGGACFEIACCGGLVCLANEVDGAPFTCTLETPPSPPPDPTNSSDDPPTGATLSHPEQVLVAEPYQNGWNDAVRAFGTAEIPKIVATLGDGTGLARAHFTNGWNAVVCYCLKFGKHPPMLQHNTMPKELAAQRDAAITEAESYSDLAVRSS